MPKLGIDADLAFGEGSAAIDGTGVKDLSVQIAKDEVQIKSRGYDWVRYLTGQKDAPIDFTVEADAPCVAFLRSKFYGARGSTEEFPVTFTFASGEVLSGVFLVSKFGPSSPVSGEEEYAVSLRLSAYAAANDQPTLTAPSA